MFFRGGAPGCSNVSHCYVFEDLADVSLFAYRADGNVVAISSVLISLSKAISVQIPVNIVMGTNQENAKASITPTLVVD